VGKGNATVGALRISVQIRQHKVIDSKVRVTMDDDGWEWEWYVWRL